jgi:hypothetical protein
VGTLNSDLLKGTFEIHRVPESCRAKSDFSIRSQFRVTLKELGASVVPLLGGTPNFEHTQQEFRKHPVVIDLTGDESECLSTITSSQSFLVRDDDELLKYFLACSSYNEKDLDEAVETFKLMMNEKQDKGNAKNSAASKARAKMYQNNCRKVSIC